MGPACNVNLFTHSMKISSASQQNFPDFICWIHAEWVASNFQLLCHQIQNVYQVVGVICSDMIETDVESYSDDDSTGAGLDPMNNDLLFDDITFHSNSPGAALPFTLHDVNARGKKKSQQVENVGHPFKKVSCLRCLGGLY